MAPEECATWTQRGLPSDDAQEMVMHYETSEQANGLSEIHEICVRMYERMLERQGWEPIEGTAHVHAGIDFDGRYMVSVHGLGRRTDG